MSTLLPRTEKSTPDIFPDTSPSQLPKPQRVPACMLCQRRKVKCDRNYPCANCIKSRAQCVPPAQVSHRRKRRFPERELLERLRKYEDLLHQNNIKFEPLNKYSAGDKESPNVEGSHDSDYEQPEVVEVGCSSPSTTMKSEAVYKAKNYLQAMSHGYIDPENDGNSLNSVVTEVAVKKAWDDSFEQNNYLLLGSRKTAVELFTLHPEPVQIFRLWQIYLDNVNPLLKVIHATSLQGRIIEAASNVKNISPTLEALMFSIYCMSILSLTVDDCQTKFGSPRDHLLTRYQFGCQQALLNSGFLRSADRDCLTALYLYLVSIGNRTHPQSLSSMLGIAFRIAQRMGIHSELASAKYTPLEAEMRRRLWWALTRFDTRIGEIADYKSSALASTWDCKIPLNVNDSDLRPEMKELLAAQRNPTEALFAVVCSELGDFVRHNSFNNNLNSPALNPVAKDLQHSNIPEGGELIALEKMIEDKYLKLCNSENPLHFMTIWTTRGYLAKCRLVEHYSRYPSSSISTHQTDAQENDAISYAFTMLDCDTKIMTSPLIKGYLWLSYFYFPFPAYIHIVQDMRRRPVSKHAEKAWEVMSDNCEARFTCVTKDVVPLFNIFAKVVLQGWDAREAALRQLGELISIPKIVVFIRHQLARIEQNFNKKDRPNGGTEINIENFLESMPMDFLTSMPMGFGAHSLFYNMDIGGQDSYAGIGPGGYPYIPGQVPLDIGLNQADWTTMDWTLSGRRG